MAILFHGSASTESVPDYVRTHAAVKGKARGIRFVFPIRPDDAPEGAVEIDLAIEGLRSEHGRTVRSPSMREGGMLERLLAHVRHAVLLRECAAVARHPAERQLFMVIASLHEARANRLMRQVRSSKS